jgi:hypothetical protein
MVNMGDDAEISYMRYVHLKTANPTRAAPPRDRPTAKEWNRKDTRVRGEEKEKWGGNET